jgi:hypothetical protein
MLARIRLILALVFAAPLVSGCLMVAAVDTAAGVGGLAIDATGAAIRVTGDVAEGTARVIIPGDGKDEDADEDGPENER